MRSEACAYSEETILHGRKEIAAFLQARYGFGSVGYVSAMIRAGLDVERGNSVTVGVIVAFFENNPGFTFHGVYSAEKPFAARGEGKVRVI